MRIFGITVVVGKKEVTPRSSTLKTMKKKARPRRRAKRPVDLLLLSLA